MPVPLTNGTFHKGCFKGKIPYDLTGDVRLITSWKPRSHGARPGRERCDRELWAHIECAGWASGSCLVTGQKLELVCSLCSD